jgi:hypothetical protein
MDSKFPSYRKWWSLYETLQKVYNNTVRKSVVNLAFSLSIVFSYQIRKEKSAGNGVADTNPRIGNIPSSISKVGDVRFSG